MTPVAQIAKIQAQVKGISNDKNQNGGYLGRRVSKIGVIKQPAGARSVPCHDLLTYGIYAQKSTELRVCSLSSKLL